VSFRFSFDRRVNNVDKLPNFYSNVAVILIKVDDLGRMTNYVLMVSSV